MVRNQIEKTEHNSVPREPTLFANGLPVFDSSVSAWVYSDGGGLSLWTGVLFLELLDRTQRYNYTVLTKHKAVGFV